MTFQTAKSVADARHRKPATGTVSTVRGRATPYTAKLADRIVRELSSGRTLGDICRDDGVPSRGAVRKWVIKNREDFAARYNRACEAGRAVTARTTPYTAELAERILLELSGGRSLSDVCRDDGMPGRGTVLRWVTKDIEGFAAAYTLAREIGHAPTGRPTLYTAETAEWILGELSEGRTLRDVCRDDGMPAASTVRKWEIEDRAGFAARYSVARAFGYEMMADQVVDIADNVGRDWIERRRADGSSEWTPDPGNLKRAQLRIKARCWLFSKAWPKIKGDRRGVNAKSDAGDRVATDEGEQRQDARTAEQA
jgi:transposase-like protein